MFWETIREKAYQLGTHRTGDHIPTVVQTSDGEFIEVRDVYLRPHPKTGEMCVVLDTRETV